jgi:polyhydroxybutyrate depolymerase
MWRRVGAVPAAAAGFVAALIAALVATHLVSAPAHADTLSIETRTGHRRAIVLAARQQPAPAVIVLHGTITTPLWAARRFGFAEAAAARGFAAVFPEGVGLQWNDGRRGFASHADDVAFLRRLVVEIVERGIADPDRVYISGVSNGGMMALRMVCEAAELFAGAGTVIANMPVATGADCHPARPVPIVMFNGTADGLIPYDGGGVGPFNLGGHVWGTEETAAYMAEANGCGRGPFASDSVIGKTSVTRIVWNGCPATVTLYRVNGGRHSVLGRHRIAHMLFGKHRDELSAAETIMAAFAGE